MLIACVIITTWIGTVRSEFMNLCGIGASPSLVQEIAFLTVRHSPLILKVDTINAYHWGEDLFVEVDIVMAPEHNLRVVHDVSQELQDVLETVEGVGRAVVHVDYGKFRVIPSAWHENDSTDHVVFASETDHAPEHRKTR